jgi:hypothetical protein
VTVVECGSTASSVRVRVTVVSLSSTSTVRSTASAGSRRSPRELEHVALLAAEPKHVVLPRLHDGACVRLGEGAGVVGHDIEDAGIALEEARK